MTSPMDLPLFGKVKLTETKKSELLDLWQKVLGANNITIQENAKVESISKSGEHFRVVVANGEEYITKSVLLAIGRRGTPRKLNVPGEHLEKVAYRMIEPEMIEGKNIVVAGGGDSAIEAALSLSQNNNVILTYRGDSFQRIKVKNGEKINKAIADQQVEVIYSSNILSIEPDTVTLSLQDDQQRTVENDLVYIFAGGELPTDFLQKAGINITKRFGHAILKHEKKR